MPDWDNSSHGVDARLVQAFELLRDFFKDAGERSPEVPSHWQSPLAPAIDSQAGVSATDVINSWFRAPPAERASPWDAFFGDWQRPSVPGPRWTAHPAGGAAAGGPAPANGFFSRAAPPGPDGDRLEEVDAQAAVECLYELIHAAGRRDLETAMAVIDEGYHVIEDDEEIDRHTLRRNLESWLDQLRGWEIEISLAVAPEPMPHPRGILIFAEIQVDAWHPEHHVQRSFVDERVAVLREANPGVWKIVALSSPE